MLLCLLLLLIGSAALADAPSRLVSEPFPGLLAAVEAARAVDHKLDRVGIVRDREANAYRVVFEESSDPADILNAQRIAGQAGLRVQVVSVDPSLPPPMPVAYVTVSTFTDPEEAVGEAAQARNRGELADVEPVRQDIGLTSVQLTGYTNRANARRVARNLEAEGIEAVIFSPAHERDYVVAAGAFRDDRRAREQTRRLQVLGYTNVSLVPLRGQVERYEVVVVSGDVPPGFDPAPGVITLRRPPPPPGEGVLVLGERRDPVAAFATPAQPDRTARIGLDEVRAEAGVLTDDSARADGSHYLHAGIVAEWPFNDRWSGRLAARVDSYIQTGDDDFTRTILDYGESFVRYRAPQRRVTLGAQTVLWGRMDDHAPTDRLSVQDVRRFMLDDLQDRRRAVFAARWEEFIGEYKMDFMVIPVFRPAEVPRHDNIWSPVDRSRGRIIGMPDDPLLSPLISEGRFAEDDDGFGGWGIRLSRAGRGFDYAVTLQHARHSLPYYELDRDVRAALLADPNDIGGALAASSDTFIARHPRTWVVGGDLGFSVGRSTLRFEAAWLSDHPATTEDLRYLEVEAFDWAAGVEFFPGDADLRVNVQVGGLHLMTSEDLLDRENVYTLFGDAENTFARDRWRARLRYSLGIDRHDVYLNPELAFIAWEPHEIYLGYHHFDGARDTLGGFHRDHDLITLGWRARY
ncbi:SPOR domain-containing protein [Thioalkalivibrio denitrificans]|uniref:SPOR domain-containing protein n=1 Tax=Thioalkalivibrio denitrificans TaxID=108003 RepID=UPI00158C6ADD|nr:SPOR domain-containing protein [Thioalkalivibrio denitrificans]